MDSQTPLKLVGVPGSPYSRKMRALLRYRRIPFVWIGAGTKEHEGLPAPPLPLMPILYYPKPDGTFEATSDSTFMIRRLEAEVPERSVRPADPVVALLDFLVEDYADEWVTKMMFHYRWAIPENVEHACNMLPRWRPQIPEALVGKFRESFGQRQIDRLWVVGSNAQTAPLIEASYSRLLGILEQHLQQHRFVMGARPGSADFGLYGQLTQLVQVERTSMRQAYAEAPRVGPWLDIMEDVSGNDAPEDGFFARDALPATFVALLGEVGRTYAPFLVANAAALESGAEQVSCKIDGVEWTQKPFPYQGKCLGWLREAYGELGAGDRAAFDGVIAGSGCEAIFG